MVNYPDETMRRIVDFVGLPWHADCTEFYANDRHVTTASAEQVRQPIYTTSIGRHLPYKEALAAFKEELDKAGVPTDNSTTNLH
jgi:hypothetical protein